MHRIIVLFLLFLQTLVFAQEGGTQETFESITTLASCNKNDFEFSDWISVINHKQTERGVHIFAIEITNVFTLNPTKKEFWIEFSIGPIPIHAEGSFDSITNRLEICNYAHLPIIGKVKLGCGMDVSGRISICFDVRLVRGKHDFYIQEDQLHLHFNDTTVGETYEESVALIPLPVGPGGPRGEESPGTGEEDEG